MRFKRKERVVLTIIAVMLAIVLINGVFALVKVLKSGDTAGSVKEVSAQEAVNPRVEDSGNNPGAGINDTGSSQQEKTLQDVSGITIMLDPGHGASDPGTHCGGYDEKDISLDYTLELQSALEGYGFNVILSREPYVYITPKERAEYANEMNVDLFVSIHCNYYEWDSSIAGFECYSAGDSIEGNNMSQAISDAIDSHGDILSRGCKNNNFCVLVNTKMPAILIELGYMSNSTELNNLTDPEHMKTLSAEIAEGLYNYCS